MVPPLATAYVLPSSRRSKLTNAISTSFSTNASVSPTSPRQRLKAETSSSSKCNQLPSVLLTSLLTQLATPAPSFSATGLDDIRAGGPTTRACHLGRSSAKWWGTLARGRKGSSGGWGHPRHRPKNYITREPIQRYYHTLVCLSY